MLGYTNNTGFPCDSTGKKSACSVGDLGSIPGLGRSPGEGKGYPLQYSGLENSMDCIVHGVTELDTTDSHFHIQTTHNNFSHLFPVRNAIYSNGVIILKEQ